MKIVSGIKSFSGADATKAKAWAPIWLQGWCRPYWVTDDELAALNEDGRVLSRGRLIYTLNPTLVEV